MNSTTCRPHSSYVALFILWFHILPVLNSHSSPVDQGRVYTNWFYDQAFDRLYAQFSIDTKPCMTVEILNTLYLHIDINFGEESEILEEKAERYELNEDLWVYTRHVIFTRVSDGITFYAVLEVHWIFYDDDSIYWIAISPSTTKEAPSDLKDCKTRTELHLPFQEEWLVLAGGRGIEQNYHASQTVQQFAYDFVIMKNDSMHTGDGQENEQSYCFGKSILSPADGVVTESQNDVHDNTPGVMNAEQPLGNFVVIDHGDNEFSLLAHMKRHSVMVRPGDFVKMGEVIGLSGNSGNSGVAHVHYQLQNAPVFMQALCPSSTVSDSICRPC